MMSKLEVKPKRPVSLAVLRPKSDFRNPKLNTKRGDHNTMPLVSTEPKQLNYGRWDADVSEDGHFPLEDVTDSHSRSPAISLIKDINTRRAFLPSPSPRAMQGQSTSENQLTDTNTPWRNYEQAKPPPSVPFPGGIAFEDDNAALEEEMRKMRRKVLDDNLAKVRLKEGKVPGLVQRQKKQKFLSARRRRKVEKSYPDKLIDDLDKLTIGSYRQSIRLEETSGSKSSDGYYSDDSNLDIVIRRRPAAEAEPEDEEVEAKIRSELAKTSRELPEFRLRKAEEGVLKKLASKKEANPLIRCVRKKNAICSTISRDNTKGDAARNARLLYNFQQKRLRSKKAPIAVTRPEITKWYWYCCKCIGLPPVMDLNLLYCPNNGCNHRKCADCSSFQLEPK